MTARADEQLEHQLRDLTTFKGRPAGVWRKALAEAQWSPPRRSSIRGRFWKWRAPLAAGGVVAVVAIGVGISMNREANGKPEVQSAAGRRPSAPSNGLSSLVRSSDQTPNLYVSPSTSEDAVATPPPWSLDSLYPNLSYSYQYQGNPSRQATGTSSDPVFPLTGDENPYIGSQVGGPTDAERHVIHKATIELTTGDVRAAFFKAQLLVSQALGEFVQDSALTGSEETAQANLTLRVVAGRLGEVLNALRELGEVRSEHRNGRDVTTQVVDVEARLRNERRVETELLALFDQRQNAPLDEILKLRDKLGQVRREIEQLTARREQLGRLVSLATVLVIIRAADAPVEEEEAEVGIGAYFADVVGAAWKRGWTFLADSVAALLSVLVGGLCWWALIVAGFIAYRQWRRRATTDPPPSEPRP